LTALVPLTLPPDAEVLASAARSPTSGACIGRVGAAGAATGQLWTVTVDHHSSRPVARLADDA